MKAHVQSFPKMWYFLACEVLNGSYRPSKMDESEKTAPSRKIRGVKKNNTPTILTPETNSMSAQPCEKDMLFVSGPKNRYCGRVIFFEHGSTP